MTKKNRTVFFILAILVMGATSALAKAEPDDDDLLLLIPAIIAGSNQTPVTPPPTESFGLLQIKKLHGRWQFSYFAFLDYYRFDRETVTSSSDSSLFLILGDGSLDASFITDWCDIGFGLSASYSVDTKDYLVLCEWGADLGSAFFFNTVTNTFTFTHYYYIPSTGAPSTGIPTIGNATRISNTYKEVDSQQAKTINKQDIEKTLNDMRTKRYFDHEREVKSVKMSQTKTIGSDYLRFQGQLKQMIELSKSASE